MSDWTGVLPEDHELVKGIDLVQPVMVLGK